jgi:protein TonB
MRKVYQNEKSLAGPVAALVCSAAITAAIFCILPFSHLVNKPSHTVELRKTSVAELPPEKEESQPPPQTETEKPPEAPNQPQLTESMQQIPLSADLDVAAGSGGALAGFGEIRSIAAEAAVQQDAFDVSELQQRPEAVSQVPPAYPPELRKAKIEGSVVVIFVLSDQGRVEDPRIENSSRSEFEKPALDAIKKWRFRPGVKDGQPVRSYVRMPMKFRITSS